MEITLIACSLLLGGVLTGALLMIAGELKIINANLKTLKYLPTR